MLVGDDPDLISIASEPQHGAKEILSLGGIDPTGSQDHVVRRRGATASARELRATVEIYRRGRIVLAIGARRYAAEDIIGGKLNDRRAERRRRPGHAPAPAPLIASAASRSVSALSTAV